MGWTPIFTISERFLYFVRSIGEITGELRAKGISGSALSHKEAEARSLSTHASTSIEGNPLGLTDVKRILKHRPEHVRGTEREVLNYNEALEFIYAKVKAKAAFLDVRNFERVQGLVVRGVLDDPSGIGCLRQKPVVIRNPHVPDEIIFLPPNYHDVRDLTKALFSFVRGHIGKMEPVLLAGLFHRQSVIIHPFLDGNGRTTRLFTSAILGASGLDFFSLFSFENYYNRNVSRYFRMVGLQGDYYEVKDRIDHTAWLEYFAEGILDELDRVRRTIGNVPERLPDHLQRLLDHIGERGSVNQSEYGRISNRSLPARKKDFHRLIELGLIESRGGGRSLYYVLVNAG